MKSLLRFTGMLLLVSIALSSCKKSVPKQVKYIPKDASFVFGINPQSIQEKLSKGQLSLDSLFKTAMTESNGTPEDIKKWEDLKNAGLDWSTELYAFVQTKGSIMSASSTAIGAVAALSDAAKFEAFLKKQSPEANVQKGKDYSYTILKGGTAVGWNNDVAIIAYMTGSKNFGDTISAIGTDASQQLTTLFALKEADAVISIPEFKELITEKADALLWQNSTNAIAAIPFLGMTKAADLLKDAYSAGTLNFEDGKAVATYRTYTGKALSDILKKYAGPTVEVSTVEQYPSTNLNGFAVFSFDPQILIEILKFTGFDGVATQQLSKQGFSLEDITKAFKGDFAVVFSDLAQEEKPSEFDPSLKIKKTIGKFLFNAKIGDKAAYTKLATQLSAMGLLTKQGNQYVPAQNGGTGMAGSLDEKNLLIASDSLLLQQYKAGTGKNNLPGDLKDRVKGKSVAFYVDIHKVLQAFPANDSATAAVTSLAKNTFKDFLATSDNFDGKNVKGIFELRTMNEKENSLVSIVKFSTAAAQQANAARERSKALQENSLLDTTVAAPQIEHK